MRKSGKKISTKTRETRIIFYLGLEFPLYGSAVGLVPLKEGANVMLDDIVKWDLAEK